MLLFVALFVFISRHLVPGGADGYTGVGFAAGGWTPRTNDYPWAVGVHKIKEGRFSHICGGSLINAGLVLSAAHCFWNGGKDVHLEEYRISAGNSQRDPDSDSSAQKKEVKDAIFHERYRGYDLNYAHDIVIVVLKGEVFLNSDVSPLAIDWSPYFEDIELQTQYGTVVGWGFTELDEPSNTRVAVGLPYVDFDNCYQVVPREFRRYLTPDKFCAGLQNGTAVCPGDSGGGLAFYNPSSNSWYLRGIVSVGVRPKGSSKCHKTQYSAFTSISHYRTWIQQKLQRLYNPNSSTQRAPEPYRQEEFTFSK